MNIIELIRKFIPEGSSFKSPLYSKLTFTKIRPFDPTVNESPDIIECKTLAGNVVLFNHEGKPIIFHPSGDMIFETNMGECMVYPDDCSWEKYESIFNKFYNKNNTKD